MKFDEDFQFVKGGKLHGLGPDSPITGGKPMRPDGWSARVTFKEAGSLRSYLYCQNKEGQYGTGIYAPDFRFQKEKYYAVSLHVRLNEKAIDSDGFAHIYINGKRVVKKVKKTVLSIGRNDSIMFIVHKKKGKTMKVTE